MSRVLEQLARAARHHEDRAADLLTDIRRRQRRSHTGDVLLSRHHADVIEGLLLATQALVDGVIGEPDQ